MKSDGVKSHGVGARWLVVALACSLVLPLTLRYAPAPARAADVSIVNETGSYLPELALQVQLALGALFDEVPGRLIVTVDFLEATNLRDRNITPFPFGPRQVMPRGFVNDWATVMVQGKLERWVDGLSMPESRRFLGRCAAWQDYEPHFATARAHRPYSGFQAYPGRLDPNGPLVVGALGNAFVAGKLDRWLLGR